MPKFFKIASGSQKVLNKKNVARNNFFMFNYIMKNTKKNQI